MPLPTITGKKSLCLWGHSTILFDACFVIRAQVHRLKKDTKAAWMDIEQAIEHGTHDKLTLRQVKNGYYFRFGMCGFINNELHEIPF
jgi:hypothetical protein